MERIYRKSEMNNSERISIPDEDFDSLKRFILDNSETADTAMNLFRRQGKEVIRFNNYVGVIETKSGFTIEVLPKIHHTADEDEQRSIFLNMLRYLKNSPFRNISEAHLKTQSFPVLEIFVAAFLSEMDVLLEKGLKRAYTEQEENLDCAKGSIHFPKHLTKNIVHKEKFYVTYDEFTLDIPQNRILKNALHYLLHRSQVYKNKRRLNQYLQIWDAIPYSRHPEADFQRINGHNRLYSHYEKPLQWAKVFLKGESFTNFRGKSVNSALLFPMERIFEDYVSAMFRKHFVEDGLRLRIQDRRKYLVDRHVDKSKFRLMPDIVIEENSIPIAILDTKWKAVNQYTPEKNYGISQADMYQLFAYGNKYEANPKLFLIYPSNEYFDKPLDPFHYLVDGMELVVVPFRLSRNKSLVWNFIDMIKTMI
jgi:5-methylcytosine-specific restriction enzyme subunit McrC